VTRHLVADFIEAMPKTPGANLEVLDPASLPQRPFEPNRPVWVAIGLILGLMLGSVVFGIGRWPKVAAAGFGTGFVVLIGAYFIPDSYMSIAVLRGADMQGLQAVEQAVHDPGFLRSLIQGPLALYPGQPVDRSVEEMQRDLQLKPVSAPGAASQAVLISFRYTDESIGFAPARKHSARYKTQEVVRGALTHALQAAPVQVLDPASLPEQSYSPNRLFLVICGLLAGMAIGVVWQVRGSRPAAAAIGHA